MNQDHPLVSMITYCYNGEHFLHRYFEGILAQTYPNIELIFIDNGSQDDTQGVASRYIAKLEARNIQVHFLRYEKNQSTCRMKEVGLSKMHGEYFFGCDSDDVIYPTYIEEMCAYLVSHPGKGIVFCQLRSVSEETGEPLGLLKVQPKAAPKAAFVDMLYARNTVFTPISYMMSRSHFLHVNPQMKINNSLYGENYQMQLPFLYNDLQGYIEKPLGDYYVRKASYSGALHREYAKQVKAFAGQMESISATLDLIGAQPREVYEKIYRVRLSQERFYASLHLPDRALRAQCYQELKRIVAARPRDHVAYYFRPLYLLLSH